MQPTFPKSNATIPTLPRAAAAGLNAPSKIRESRDEVTSEAPAAKRVKEETPSSLELFAAATAFTSVGSDAQAALPLSPHTIKAEPVSP
jgi:hypothetical protein